MFAGHFAVAFLAKRFEPGVSLGAFMLAAMLPDLLSEVLVIGGVEKVEIGSGKGAANYFHATNIAYSHSLGGGVVFGAIFAGGFWGLRRSMRGAWLIFASVLSHWILDVISHRPDMPIAPGLDLFFGLGLWASAPTTMVVEGGFWLFALVWFLRGQKWKSRLGPYTFWVGAALLTLLWRNNVADPPPPSAAAMEIGGAIVFASLIGWGFWLDSLSEKGLFRPRHENQAGRP